MKQKMIRLVVWTILAVGGAIGSIVADGSTIEFNKYK